MKSNNHETNLQQTHETNRLQLGKHLDFLNNNPLLRQSNGSLGIFNQDQASKENILDGEDCSSKFEQTQFLENASSRTWKKRSSQIGGRASLLLSKQMEQDPFTEKAIQFIRVTKTGDFEVTEEGTNFLKSVDGPLVVLGVAGMYRTGKSYLLNKVILRSEHGFGVAPTINACTKGIWIFGKPFRVKLEDGRFANLIVMDSEGLGALDQDSGHDCRIFALVLLLSSMFLYNSVGTIDENAISSLSLVINLTRHIKVKGGNNSDMDSEDEEDPEELAKFFPSFLWVLRDFALELVNTMGEDISPQQYLENSLAAHKGISDEVERKNRVRRMIKQFFPERNCFPLVRPLLNEDDLQRLDDLSMDKLRPEFLSQSLHLRELLFSKSKPKQMHNREISGQVLAGLAQEYVRAINGGAVPNIESAWTYVCSAQREKLRLELVNSFEEALEEETFGKMPMEETQLEEMIKETKLKMKARFKRESLDGIDEEERRRLKEGMKDKSERVREQNRFALEDLVKRVMNKGFNEHVEMALGNFQKQKNGFKAEEMERNKNLGRGLLEETETFEWVDREAQTWNKFQEGVSLFMEQMLTSLAPVTVAKQQLLYSFLTKKVLEKGGDCYEDLVKSLKLTIMAKDSRLGLLIEKAKGCEELLSKIKKTSKQRIEELEETTECLGMEREALERRLEMQARELRNELREKEAGFEEEVKEIREKMQVKEERDRKDKEVLRAKVEGQKKKVSEMETNNMLLEQKVEFFEKDKAELSEQKQRLMQKVRGLEEQNELEAESLRKELESKMRGLQQEAKKTKEQFREYKEEVTQQSILQESMCRQMGSKEENLMQRMEGLRKEARESKQKENDAYLQLQKAAEDLEEVKNELQEERQKKGQDGEQVKRLKKEISNERKENEKQGAIWAQEMEFVKEERDDLESQLGNLRKVHEKMVRTMEMQKEEDKGGKKTQFHEGMRKEMEQRLLRVEGVKAEMEFKLREELKEMLKQKGELGEEVEKVKGQHLKYEDELKSEQEKNQALKKIVSKMEEQQKRLVKDTEGLWKDKVRRAEAEVLKEKEKRDDLLRGEREEFEIRMQDMREFFEEKQKSLESKAKMEKDAAERKRKELNEEWVERFENGKMELEEDVEELETKMREFEEVAAYWKDRTEKLGKEVENRLQSEKRDKEKVGGELRARLGLEVQKVEQLEKELSKERADSKGNFEGLKKELLSKNAQLGELRQRMDFLTDKMEREKAERQGRVKKFKAELVVCSDRLTQAKNENIRLAEELIQMRVDFGKEKALSQQRVEFKEKKISELEEKSEMLSQRQQQEVERVASAWEKKMEEINKIHRKDLLESDQRLEEKRQTLKEMGVKAQVKLVNLEKQNTKLQERIRSMEEKLHEHSTSKGKESEKAERELLKLKESSRKSRAALEEELEKQREKAYEAEIALTEIVARLDKEEALWKGQVDFLKKQKAQLKNDLVENQKTYDIMVTKLNEYRSEVDSEREESLSRQIDEMGHHHQIELSDLKKKHQSRESEYAERLSFLEHEVTRLERLNQQTVSKRFGSRLSEEKKLNELLEKEKLLQDEVMMLKCEKDSIGLVYQREMEKEREQWKLRLFEMECAVKKGDNERNLLVFEHEKQRTKWMIERDNWVFHKQENVEVIEKLQRQKDHLTKDNERLKQNIKGLKKSNLGYSIVNCAKSRYMATPKKL